MTKFNMINHISRELIRAAENDDITEMKILLDYISDKDFIKVSTSTPGSFSLIACAHRRFHEGMKYLIERGFPLRNLSCCNDTALTASIERNDSLGVKILIEAGADINENNPFKDNSLIIACRNGYLEVAELLIDAGANTDRAYHAAVGEDRYLIVKLLLSKNISMPEHNNIIDYSVIQYVETLNYKYGDLI